ncbi:MAG: S4 domain-containing protein [Rhodanobacteraceae bacterium]
MDDSSQTVRADVWLWAARFFKTRRLCREAIDAGQVDLNGHGCKPGKAVKPGDTLVITRHNERYQIDVRAVADRRGPAETAQGLYQEHEASIAERLRARELNRLAGRAAPGKRPDKRARRELSRLKKG